jgi:hypothetical protein
VRLLETRDCGVDLLERCQRASDGTEKGKHCVALTIEGRRSLSGEMPQLLCVRKPSHLFSKRRIFTRDEPGVAELAHNMAQPVLARTRIGPAPVARVAITNHCGKAFEHFTNGNSLHVCGCERVEDAALCSGIEE